MNAEVHNFERSIALKAMRLSAEFRTNLGLMRRSRKVTTQECREAEKECALYLAQSNLIYPPSLKAVGLFEGQPLPDRKCRLGIDYAPIDETPETLEFQEMLATAGRKQIKANWIWRIGQECLEKSLEGWYGFFVTLTVDPARVPDSQAMWQEGKEFRKYIRRLARVAAKASGFPRAIKDGASCCDFVHHVGVIEHGKSRQHHHMHLLVWMRDIPASWKVCPNRGVRAPHMRTNDWCKAMSTYWPNALPGIGRAKYFRHEGDMWSRHGFVLPYDRKKKRIVRIHAPEKAGLYIAKYMDKDDKAWTHRIKATRDLGMTRLRKVLMQMHWKKVEALAWRPKTYSLNTTATTIHTVPPGLLRLTAKQESFCRKWARNTLDFPKLLRESYDSFSLMLKSVRDGARPKRMRSSQFYEWVTAHLPDPEGYCEKRYLRAVTSLGVHFPPINHQPVQHTGMT
jgi:hypothetical protein